MRTNAQRLRAELSKWALNVFDRIPYVISPDAMKQVITESQLPKQLFQQLKERSCRRHHRRACDACLHTMTQRFLCVDGEIWVRQNSGGLVDSVDNMIAV